MKLKLISDEGKFSSVYEYVPMKYEELWEVNGYKPFTEEKLIKILFDKDIYTKEIEISKKIYSIFPNKKSYVLPFKGGTVKVTDDLKNAIDKTTKKWRSTKEIKDYVYVLEMCNAGIPVELDEVNIMKMDLIYAIKESHKLFEDLIELQTNGITHKDINPYNITIKDNKFYIIDFNNCLTDGNNTNENRADSFNMFTLIKNHILPKANRDKCENVYHTIMAEMRKMMKGLNQKDPYKLMSVLDIQNLELDNTDNILDDKISPQSILSSRIVFGEINF